MHYQEYWDEEIIYEDAPVLNLNPEKVKAEVHLALDELTMERAISEFVDKTVENRIKYLVNKAVNEALKRLAAKDAYRADNLNALMSNIIEKRMLEMYPDVVENKVNEFYETLNKATLSERKYDSFLSDMTESAKKMKKASFDHAERAINAYINDELKKSVEKSTEYIEQFSRNYFANNLFKAMGMMDAMMPQTQNNLENNGFTKLD